MVVKRKISWIMIITIFLCILSGNNLVKKVNALENIAPVIVNMKTTIIDQDVFQIDFDVYDDGDIIEEYIQANHFLYEPDYNGDPFEENEPKQIRIITMLGLGNNVFNCNRNIEFIGKEGGLNKYHICISNIDYNSVPDKWGG